MDKIRRAFFIAGGNFKKWAVNPRMYVVFLLAAGYTAMMLRCISDFCKSSGYKITPWVFPFFIAQPYSLLMILLGLILLFCDAPFMESEQPYIILRVGRKTWTAGQIIYIAAASAIYFLVVAILTILVLLPHLSLESSWGRVINSFSQNGASRYGVVIPFDYAITSTFTPIQAMLLEYLLCWLAGVFLGLLLFVLNLAISRSAGVIATAAFAVFPLFVRRSDYWLHYISPCSWTSLSVVNFSGASSFPSPFYVFSGFFLLIASLVITALLLMGQRDIDVLKSV